MDIKLGNIVKEASTGFTGTACMIMTSLGGTQHVTIQPPCPEDSNVLPQDQTFDIHLVDVIGPGVADRVYPQDGVEHLPLGKCYRDVVSGFEGIAVAKVESLHGCVQYSLTPKAGDKKDAEFPTSIYFDYKRLELISEGVIDKIAQSASGSILTTGRTQSALPRKKA